MVQDPIATSMQPPSAAPVTAQQCLSPDPSLPPSSFAPGLSPSLCPGHSSSLAVLWLVNGPHYQPHEMVLCGWGHGQHWVTLRSGFTTQGNLQPTLLLDIILQHIMEIKGIHFLNRTYNYENRPNFPDSSTKVYTILWRRCSWETWFWFLHWFFFF